MALRPSFCLLLLSVSCLLVRALDANNTESAKLDPVSPSVLPPPANVPFRVLTPTKGTTTTSASTSKRPKEAFSDGNENEKPQPEAEPMNLKPRSELESIKNR